MFGDERWSITFKGLQIIIKGLNPNNIPKSIYKVQWTFMFFAKIQTKNQKTHCKLGILKCNIYDEPK
jgi:hypothetical protein